MSDDPRASADSGAGASKATGRRASSRRRWARRSRRASAATPREPIAPPTIDEIELPRAARRAARLARARSCTDDPDERAGHTYGKSFRDVWRGLHRDFSQPPDLVAIPRDEHDIVVAARLVQRRSASPRSPTAAARRWSAASSATSTTTTAARSASTSARSTGCSRSTATSRAARIQAGVYGPALEDQLRPHGLTLRHFPQSFEFSTLGGWLATRSGGHYATLHTHIDDFVESIRAVTPRGVWESRRLPGSGAGPSPDRMLLGSEGMLGVITEAWMRLQDRPTFRASATARFATFSGGVDAARAIAQSGLLPGQLPAARPARGRSSPAPTTAATRCCCSRSSRPTTRSTRGSRARSSARATTARASTTTRSSIRERRRPKGAREGAAGSWRNAFVRAPYTRDALVGLGVISETFETACTWDRFDALHEAVTTAVLDTAEAAGAWPAVDHVPVHARVSRRSGAVLHGARARPGRRAARAVGGDQGRGRRRAHPHRGGTITHHHAVGRDHRRWYDRQRPEPFAAALRAAKRAVDPAGILNPGVLVDPVDPAIDRLMTYRAVIFDLGGVVFPSPFEAFDAYDRGNGLDAGHDARADPTSSETGAWAALERGELTHGRVRRRARSGGGRGRLRARRARGSWAMIAIGVRPAAGDGARDRAHPRRRAAHRRAHEQLAARRRRTRRRPTANALGFDVIVESAVVGLRKPDPRIYELVLARLDVRRERRPCSSTTSASTSSRHATMGMTTIKVADPDDALAELAATLGFEVH